MEILVLLIGFILSLVLLFIGFIIKYKRAYWLVSSYNEMSFVNKQNIDIAGLGKFTAKICFIVSFTILISIFLKILSFDHSSVFVITLIFPIIVYTLIKTQSFDQDTKDNNGKMKLGIKILIIITSLFLSSSVIGIYSLMYIKSIPTKYTILNDSIQISGIKSEQISFKEITSIEFTNNLKTYENLKNFAQNNSSPYIVIKEEKNTLIINLNTYSETNKLYKKLNLAINSSKKQSMY